MSARGPELVTLPAGMDPGCDGQAGEECLKDAPTNRRMAFVLREVQGLSTEEICKIPEVTRTNLGVLIHRECLEAKGVTG